MLSHGKLALERSLSDLQGGIVKLQVSFQSVDPPEPPQHLQVPHRSNLGRIYTYIVRGTSEDVLNGFATLNPLFQEAVPLTLEEIFIYEMGGEDYAVREIVF